MSTNTIKPTRTRCSFQVLASGIYEFTMAESSREAVDELFEIMEELGQRHSLNVGGGTLLDSSVGIQPLNYIFARFRAFAKEHPSEQNSSKLAMLIPANPLLQALDLMMRAFPFVKTRIFRPEQREAALRWLLE